MPDKQQLSTIKQLSNINVICKIDKYYNKIKYDN